jgi:hypothetical protein
MDRKLDLPASAIEQIRADLPAVASATVTAVLEAVPGYGALGDALGTVLEESVEIALRGFLKVASGARGTGQRSPLRPALDAAYELGRGEMRNGRSMDALLAAYRVGSRVAWREWSGVAVAAGVSAEGLAHFAELNFAYIDELSAASALGRAEESATSDRVLQRELERLARQLLTGAAAEALQAAADRAGWTPPPKLAAVLVPGPRARGLRPLLDPRTLQLTDDLPGIEADDETLVLLVPVTGSAGGRARLRRQLADRGAVLGQPRPWTQVQASYDRAVRVQRLGIGGDSDTGADVIDVEDHLTQLVLRADPEALADLRAQVLAPLAELRPATAEKLSATLRAWLLHQGRREEVAASLFVHPQTVRYRMTQLRELYGDRLDDPDTVLAATVALATTPAPAP